MQWAVTNGPRFRLTENRQLADFRQASSAKLSLLSRAPAMTTDKLRTYHRTYLSIYHDTGPFIQGCNPNREEQRLQKQLQDFRVNQLPRLEQMRKGPPTENTRRVLAEMMGIT